MSRPGRLSEAIGRHPIRSVIAGLILVPLVYIAVHEAWLGYQGQLYQPNRVAGIVWDRGYRGLHVVWHPEVHCGLCLADDQHPDYPLTTVLSGDRGNSIFIDAGTLIPNPPTPPETIAIAIFSSQTYAQRVYATYRMSNQGTGLFRTIELRGRMVAINVSSNPRQFQATVDCIMSHGCQPSGRGRLPVSRDPSNYG